MPRNYMHATAAKTPVLLFEPAKFKYAIVKVKDVKETMY